MTVMILMATTAVEAFEVQVQVQVKSSCGSSSISGSDDDGHEDNANTRAISGFIHYSGCDSSTPGNVVCSVQSTL